LFIVTSTRRPSASILVGYFCLIIFIWNILCF
jgi:hypothetical protein